MRTTIDRAGRIVIPKSIRERVGLVDGGEVEIYESDGEIGIAPSSSEVRIVDSPTGPIFRSDEDLPPLGVDTVRGVIEQARR
jgi:AbrB family looped-hinge helix DNA binding protein